MGMIISCHGIDKKYILINVYLFLINIAIYFIELLIKNLAQEEAIEKDEKLLVFQYLIRYIIFTLFIIPEIIIRNTSSLIKNKKSKELKYKFKLKDYAIILLIALIMLINQFTDIFLNILQWKRLDIVREENKFVFNFLFIFIISTFFLKNKTYIHQYIATIFLILLGIIKDIYLLYQQDYFQYNNSEIIVIFILNIIEVSSLSFYFTYTKALLIDKYYFSPYKVCYIFGIINGIIFLIISIILSFIPCNNSLCLMKYNNEKFFDNYKYFLQINFSKQLLYLLQFLKKAFYFVFVYIIIGKYTIFHIFLPFLFFTILGDIFAIVKEGIYKLFISILVDVFQFLNTLVFLEIIELKFCGLNIYTQYNIKQRAFEDSKDLLVDKLENIEVDSEYLVEYSDMDDKSEGTNIHIELKKQ